MCTHRLTHLRSHTCQSNGNRPLNHMGPVKWTTFNSDYKLQVASHSTCKWHAGMCTYTSVVVQACMWMYAHEDSFDYVPCTAMQTPWAGKMSFTWRCDVCQLDFFHMKITFRSSSQETHYNLNTQCFGHVVTPFYAAQLCPCYLLPL